MTTKPHLTFRADSGGISSFMADQISVVVA